MPTNDYSFQVADVKESIETSQGSDVYPAAQQMLIHQGKVLKDGTTLEENKVLENSFVVIMLTKVSFFSSRFVVSSTLNCVKHSFKLLGLERRDQTRNMVVMADLRKPDTLILQSSASRRAWKAIKKYTSNCNHACIIYS